ELHVHLLAQLARQRVDGRLAGLDLAAGQLPEVRQVRVGPPARQEDCALGVEDQRGNDQLAGTGLHRLTSSLARRAPVRKPDRCAHRATDGSPRLARSCQSSQPARTTGAGTIVSWMITTRTSSTSTRARGKSTRYA